MCRTLFGRLFTLFMIVIVLVTLVTAIYSSFFIRDNMIDVRLENLLTQAKDISFLASHLSKNNSTNSITMEYLQEKTKMVYDEYEAVMVILDSKGRALHNIQSAIQGSGDALSTLDTKEMSAILIEVLRGKETITRITKTSHGTVFTVAAPYITNNTVSGAVFIHTSAQVINVSIQEILLKTSWGFLFAALFAIISTAFYTRSIVKPLTEITIASETMMRGNLNVRAHVTGVDEVRKLAGAFNLMVSQLEVVEENRKEFVANVSHELRTPVTSIHSFVEGILDGTIPESEHEKYLKIVFDETNRMKRLISDLLELSRMDKGVVKLNFKAFDINELIRRVIISRITDFEKKNVDIKINFVVDPCMVCADSDRISQVLINLIDNSIRYLPKNGILTISTNIVHDSNVEISIENDGLPISPEDRPHVFDRFFKADKAHTSGNGTGLGLSICKQIIDLHEQTIKVLPLTEGAGFSFTLRYMPKEQRLMIPGKV